VVTLKIIMSKGRDFSVDFFKNHPLFNGSVHKIRPHLGGGGRVSDLLRSLSKV
jgi:hypothetical protein